jgi:hypothetical protein
MIFERKKPRVLNRIGKSSFCVTLLLDLNFDSLLSLLLCIFLQNDHNSKAQTSADFDLNQEADYWCVGNKVLWCSDKRFQSFKDRNFYDSQGQGENFGGDWWRNRIKTSTPEKRQKNPALDRIEDLLTKDQLAKMKQPTIHYFFPSK